MAEKTTNGGGSAVAEPADISLNLLAHTDDKQRVADLRQTPGALDDTARSMLRAGFLVLLRTIAGTYMLATRTGDAITWLLGEIEGIPEGMTMRPTSDNPRNIPAVTEVFELVGPEPADGFPWLATADLVPDTVGNADIAYETRLRLATGAQLLDHALEVVMLAGKLLHTADDDLVALANSLTPPEADNAPWLDKLLEITRPTTVRELAVSEAVGNHGRLDAEDAPTHLDGSPSSFWVNLTHQMARRIDEEATLSSELAKTCGAPSELGDGTTAPCASPAGHDGPHYSGEAARRIAELAGLPPATLNQLLDEEEKLNALLSDAQTENEQLRVSGRHTAELAEIVAEADEAAQRMREARQ